MKKTYYPIKNNHYHSFSSDNEAYNFSNDIDLSENTTKKVDLLKSNYINHFYGLNALGGGMALADRFIRASSKNWFSMPAQILSMGQVFLSFAISYYAYKESNEIKKEALKENSNVQSIVNNLLIEIKKRHKAAVVSVFGDSFALISQIISIIIELNKGLITPLSPTSSLPAKLTVIMTSLATIMTFPMLYEISKNTYLYLKKCLIIKKETNKEKWKTNTQALNFINFMSDSLQFKSYIFRALVVLTSFVSRLIFTVWLTLQLCGMIPKSTTTIIADKMNSFMINFALAATIIEVGYGLFLLISYIKKQCCEKVKNQNQELKNQLINILTELRSERNSVTIESIMNNLKIDSKNIQNYKLNNNCSDITLFQLARDLNLIHLI